MEQDLQVVVNSKSTADEISFAIFDVHQYVISLGT